MRIRQYSERLHLLDGRRRMHHQLSLFGLLWLALSTTTAESRRRPPSPRTTSHSLASAASSATIRALEHRCGSSEGKDKERISSEEESGAEMETDAENAVPLSIGSLFQLSNEIKAKAAAAPEGPISPHNKGRGGAVAVVKAPESRALFGAFDMSSAKPLSSRLIKDEESKAPTVTVEGKKDALITKEDSSIQTVAQPQHFWWNNAWQQQFPDGEEVIAETELTAEDAQNEVSKQPRKGKEEVKTIEEEDEGFDELEVIIQAEKDERKKKTVDSTEDKETMAQNHEGDPDILPIPEEVASQERIILPPSVVEDPAAGKRRYEPVSPYESSGYWRTIDNVLSAGFASSNPSLRISRHLRVLRKHTAQITGLHGVISGKERRVVRPPASMEGEDDEQQLMLRRRLAAIDRARGNLALAEKDGEKPGRRRGLFGRILSGEQTMSDDDEHQASFILQQQRKTEEEEGRRKRVQEIDEQIALGQKRLLELATEKDILQRRPNPLWNYTTTLEELDQARRHSAENNTTETKSTSVKPSRHFNFPPPDVVDEYLTMLIASGRMVKLNHTDLWRGSMDEDVDDDEDDWLSSSPMKEAAGLNGVSQKKKNENGNGNGGGSRWLRNGLGEKLGESVETAAYRAVGGGVMSFLSKTISSIHGITVMGHTDIRLFPEQTPNLPPVAGIIPGAMGSSSYAQGAFENVLRRGARKYKKRRKRRDDSFIQRDAVVETLLSQSQIAMPLLKIFPLAWQRAMLGNVVTLVTAIMMDFCEGLEFQILGHRLSFSFVPITEEDMMRHWASAANDVFSRRHRNAARFEAAVHATAQDVAGNLNFLDRWHERILGGDALRTQLSNLIARLVLTLVDETLNGARMDLWTTHAGGPRLIAGLEYRTEAIKE